MPITVLIGNVPAGPFTREQIAEKLRIGEITLTDLAFIDGLSQWTPLREVLTRVDGVAPAAPARESSPPPVRTAAPVASSQPPAVAAYSYAATMAPPTHLVYASFWARVGAHIIDNLIVSIPFTFIWVMLFGAIIGFGAFAQLAHQDPNAQAAAGVAMIGGIIFFYITLVIGRFLAIWLYHAVLESGPHQATWGKRALGLKVTGVTGQRISFGHASGRYFSTFVTNMTMGIGYLMVAFTDRKQALHDMIADTLVIKQ